MGIHITKYETKNGKTRRVPQIPKAGKTGSPDVKTGDEKNNLPTGPASKGA